MLPHLYHAHHGHHLEDLAFWSRLATSQGGPLLELGCGTGRLTLPLAEQGFAMVGLDRDAGMLAWLLGRIPPALQPSIWLFQADMTSFRLARRFPLILLPCNTLSALAGSDRGRLYRCVRAHLSPGGLFAASLPNPAVLAELPHRGESELEEVVEDPLTGNPIQVSSSWSRAPGQVTVRWHYDHLRPDGHVTRQTVEVRHDLISLESHRTELRTGGLQLTATHGDFDFAPYSNRAPMLIMLAESTPSP